MVDIGGQQIHLVDHGGEGPPLLLVHGLAGSAVDWRDVAPALAAHHHVVALDLPGFGRSPHGPRRASISRYQHVVAQVAAHVGGGRPVVLVGNSMGGLVAMLVAARNPQRVAALVLVDPALPRRRGGWAGFLVAAAFVLVATPVLGPLLVRRGTRRRTAEALVDEVLRLCSVDAHRIAPETRAAQIELTVWRENLDDPHRAVFEATFSLLLWLAVRLSVHRLARAITAPTLLVHGERDVLVGVHAARAICRVRPSWELHVFAETGHIPQMERPEEFLDVVESWLDQHGGEAEPRAAPERSPAGAGSAADPAVAGG